MRKRALSLVLAAAMVIGLVTPGTSAQAAAKVKLSAKKLTLTVGQSKTLTVKKGSKKVKSVKWKTSNAKVATVKKGKVTAKKAGTAKITATVSKKKYTCKVTVKAKTAPVTTEHVISAVTTEQKSVPTTQQPAVSTTESQTVPVPATEDKTPQTVTTEDKTGANVTTEDKTGTDATTEDKTGTSATTEDKTGIDATTEEETTELDSEFFKNNVEIEYSTIVKHVDFDLKTDGGGEPDPVEVQQLEELGFKIENGKATKDQQCESVKYTFKKLPTNLEQIESFFAEEEKVVADESGTVWNYGGFNAMAANICAACTFKGGSNPSDPMFSNDPVRDMFEYINGPASSMDIAKAQMDNAITSMKQAIETCGENVYKSYFNGATTQNYYTPDQPYVLEMYKGPYYIESKETITGTRPTTYMILVKSGGADSERYIDVYESTKTGRWFSYENQFMHVIANDFKTPVKPVDPEKLIPEDNGYFSEHVKIDYDIIEKHVDFDLKTDAEGNPDPAEVAELEELGFTIEDGRAVKDQKCEAVKYTIDKLPETVEDIKSFFAAKEKIETDENGTVWNYGGFNAMAANICAACTFKGGSNPSDPYFSKDPVREMFEYINGPSESMDIAKAQMDNAISSMKSAIQACGENVYKSYFNGATPKNNYTPDEPFVLEMYKGPYYIEAKETITGERPTTYMILVKSGGADSEKYIDVYEQKENGIWYSFENQFMHVIANDFKEPAEQVDPDKLKAEDNGYFSENVSIEYGTTVKHVDFDLKMTDGAPDPAEVAELEAKGFTIQDGKATKDQVCESVKYTFKKLPETVEDIKSFFAEKEKVVQDEQYGELNYGGFNAMAANICAACTFKGGSNPADPMFEKDPSREMFEYINGPLDSTNIANAQWQTAVTSMKQAIQSCGGNVYKSFFNGATPKNNYEPGEPFVLEMYKGPYYIEAKETINGDRPTTYMILVKSGGEDSERYIDVYEQEENGIWYSFENQFMHITANNFKVPEEEL